MADPIRIYLLDDHDVVREGLKFLLEQQEDIVVVGESASATEAAARAGFPSYESLRRAFARHLGVSPTRYRQRFASTRRDVS